MRKYAGTFASILSLILLAHLGFQGCNKSNLTTPPPVSVPIKGTVVDSTTNIPAPFANVELGSSGVRTSPTGTYSFSNSQIQSGNYVMKVVADGYQTASKSIRVISDTTQVIDFFIQALQETVSLNSTIQPNSYSATNFSFANYPFVQCSNNIMSHDVNVTIQIDALSQPIHVIVVSPDGSYKIDNDVSKAGLDQTFMANSCSNWAVVLYDSEGVQAACSGKVTMDFSNYPISNDTLLTNVVVPFSFPSIAENTAASFSRFMEIGMGYQLSLNISGSTNNDIGLIISDPDSNILFNESVNNNYSSPTFIAAKNGFYKFEFANVTSFAPNKSNFRASSIASARSVYGTLVINHLN